MSHIKAHQRTVHGKVQLVHAYDDKRTGKKRQPRQRAHVVEVMEGAEKMKATISSLLATPTGLDELEEKIKQGGFRRTFPEVTDLWGLEQGHHHKYRDAFDHTMQVIRHLPEDASDTVRWAALLHDIGKVDTQKVDAKRGVVFDGHEYVGSVKVKKVLARMGFSKEEKDKIKYLIRHHGDLRAVFLRGTDEKAKEFMENEHFDDLLMIHKADVLASGRDPKEVMEKVQQLKQQLG